MLKCDTFEPSHADSETSMIFTWWLGHLGGTMIYIIVGYIPRVLFNRPYHQLVPSKPHQVTLSPISCACAWACHEKVAVLIVLLSWPTCNKVTLLQEVREVSPLWSYCFWCAGMIELLSRKPMTSCCNFKRSWTKCTTQGLCSLLTQLFLLDQMTRSHKKMCRPWSCHMIVTNMTWQGAPWSQNLAIFRKRPQASCMLGCVSCVLVPWAISKPYSDGLRNLTYDQ